MKNEILASESFSHGKRRYFLDIRLAGNDSNYLLLTRSEQQEDGSYKRWSFVVFENQFEDFISAFAALFRSAAYQGKGFVTVKQLHQELKSEHGIKAMPAELRPREKMAASGPSELEDAELLAMLIGSGSPNESALGLAEQILEAVGGSIKNLAAMSLAELCGFRGMGMAKSSTVLAAMELALRLSVGTPVYKTVYLYKKQVGSAGSVDLGN